MERLRDDGVTRFLEVGTGHVISGLARRTLGRDFETHTAGTAEELEGLSSVVSSQ